MFFSIDGNVLVAELGASFGPAPSLVPSFAGAGGRRCRGLPAEEVSWRKTDLAGASCSARVCRGFPRLRRDAGGSAFSCDFPPCLPSVSPVARVGFASPGGFPESCRVHQPWLGGSQGRFSPGCAGRGAPRESVAPNRGLPAELAPKGGVFGGDISFFRLSPQSLTPVLCPRRSPGPYAAPRDARPSSAHASSRLQRSPSPSAVRLPESPPAPPACPEAPRGAAARPLEGPPALNVVPVTPPPCWGSFSLCPQTFLSPRTNGPAPKRGSWLQPCRSSPLFLSLSPSFSPFLFIVFIFITFPLLLPFTSTLKIFQGAFTRVIFFFFYVKQ